MQQNFISKFIDPVENIGFLWQTGILKIIQTRIFLQQNKDIEIEDKYSIKF